MAETGLISRNIIVFMDIFKNVGGFSIQISPF